MPMSDSRIIPIGDGTAILAENGPMHMVIQCRHGDKAMPETAMAAGEQAFGYLARVAACRQALKQPACSIKAPPEDEIARTMVESARRIGDPDLTPMAAVAGTLADFVADWLAGEGMTWVIVNNGGDIAIRLADGESARVGIRPDINSQTISHVLTLDDRKPAWGVNTSGLGGRSLTRGIASGVTVIADSSSIADSAATAIANACFVKDARIVRVPAKSLDLDTDIPDVDVTVDVGPLDRPTIDVALANGMVRAEQLVDTGAIEGAFVACRGCFRITRDLEAHISAFGAGNA